MSDDFGTKVDLLMHDRLPNLAALRVLVAIAQHQSFTGAAEALDTPQIVLTRSAARALSGERGLSRCRPVS